jgi:hypothetical protein
MEYRITKNGKRIPFKFVSKREEEKYINICLDWCGCVPIDVDWATNTIPYKERLENINKEDEKIS